MKWFPRHILGKHHPFEHPSCPFTELHLLLESWKRKATEGAYLPLDPINIMPLQIFCQRTNLKLASEYSSINHGTKYRPLHYIGCSSVNKNIVIMIEAYIPKQFLFETIFSLFLLLKKLSLTLHSSTSLRACLVVGEKSLDLRIHHCP